MTILDFLSPAEMLIDLQVRDKAGLLKELASRAAASLALPAEVVLNELEKREQLGSTGVGGGIAIPHARLHAVKQPFGLLARLKRPMEFDAVDGQPVDIVFLLLLPASSQPAKLHLLASVARRLRDGELLSKLRRATDADELYAAFSA